MEDDAVRQAVNLWYGAGFGEVPWADALHATSEPARWRRRSRDRPGQDAAHVERINVYGVDDTVDEYVARMSQINPRTLYSLKLPGPHVITDYRVAGSGARPQRVLRLARAPPRAALFRRLAHL